MRRGALVFGSAFAEPQRWDTRVEDAEAYEDYVEEDEVVERYPGVEPGKAAAAAAAPLLAIDSTCSLCYFEVTVYLPHAPHGHAHRPQKEGLARHMRRRRLIKIVDGEMISTRQVRDY
eukprot:tig00020553_g10777.t1